MNPGIRYGHRFADPPSLQKDIFTLSAKLYKILTQYKSDPEYIKYKAILDRLNIMNNYLNELISYMLVLDEQERKLYELEKLQNEVNEIQKKENQTDKIEIVVQDTNVDETLL